MALSAARSADLALAFERIDANNARAFAPLAVAFGQGRLGHALDGLIGIGARVDSAPVALFLAQPASHAPTIASLLTLNVAPAWRRRGIATKLLAAGEAAVGAAGCTTVTSMIAYGSPEGPAAQALAARAGWEQVQHLRTYFKVAYDAIGVAPWVTRRQRWPAGFDVVSFSAITGEERRQLMARQNDPDWFDAYLDPFEGEADHTANSIALRVNGEIAGWAVSRHLHRDQRHSAPGTMSWTRVYVRRPLQKRGYGAMLLAEHIKRGPAAGIAHAIFSVQPTNAAMLRLVDRHLRPVASGCRDVWEVRKRVAAGAAQT